MDTNISSVTGPHFRFSDAISLYVLCESQAEIDYYWERLTSGGGQATECGRLTDRFGVSWQIVPASQWQQMKNTDAQAVSRMLQASSGMKKLAMDALDRAFKGEACRPKCIPKSVQRFLG